MEDKSNILESLLERAEEYSKTSFELFKLKALDKASDVVSSAVSRLAAILTMMLFIVMASMGFALWLGEILGKLWYGFFLVAAFYGIAGIVLYFFMHKSLKKRIGNLFINQVLK